MFGYLVCEKEKAFEISYKASQKIRTEHGQSLGACLRLNMFGTAVKFSI